MSQRPRYMRGTLIQVRRCVKQKPRQFGAGVFWGANSAASVGVRGGSVTSATEQQHAAVSLAGNLPKRARIRAIVGSVRRVTTALRSVVTRPRRIVRPEKDRSRFPKLAQRLPRVSAEALPVEGLLGNWHADRLVLDRRRPVLFCHDLTTISLCRIRTTNLQGFPQRMPAR